MYISCSSFNSVLDILLLFYNHSTNNFLNYSNISFICTHLLTQCTVLTNYMYILHYICQYDDNNKWSTSINAMHIWMRMVTFWNTLFQIHANLFKSYFLPNIVHTKYNTFNVRDSLGGSLIHLAVLLHTQKQLLYANIKTFRECQFVII